MKRLFKFCIPKILFLLLVTNTGIRPAEVIVTAIAAEELLALVTMGTAVIGTVLTQFMSNKNKTLSIGIPGESVPIQITSVVGRSDEEVAAAVTQATTRAISRKYNLSEADQKKLYEKLCLSKEQFANRATQSRTLDRAEHNVITYRSPAGIIGSIKNDNIAKSWLLRNQAINDFKRDVYIAYELNREYTIQALDEVVEIFVNCNHPNRKKRIQARLQLPYLVRLNPNVFGHQVKKAAESLISCYFYENRLVDFSDDKRLAETMEIFLKDYPYLWERKHFKQRLFVLCELYAL